MFVKKIFLRTSEARAAKWIAETIGDIEIERLRDSRSQRTGGRQQYGLERQVEPLVMASEISGLASPARPVEGRKPWWSG
jgi:type IV secretory pathway TraG/TraD family ATPase VirD4